ncbi:hypothetical protein PIB30_049717 [Stylosanthes scabra]|uniref:Uncharacterized protein n=1 Tax=Stylosanthes scabra TaxID=79078 RepID=A0ABU6RI63_9FABA|nr:hypothetical protein [Stylosanthes scabra]
MMFKCGGGEEELAELADLVSSGSSGELGDDEGNENFQLTVLKGDRRACYGCGRSARDDDEEDPNGGGEEHRAATDVTA